MSTSRRTFLKSAVAAVGSATVGAHAMEHPAALQIHSGPIKAQRGARVNPRDQISPQDPTILIS